MPTIKRRKAVPPPSPGMITRSTRSTQGEGHVVDDRSSGINNKSSRRSVKKSSNNNNNTKNSGRRNEEKGVDMAVPHATAGREIQADNGDNVSPAAADNGKLHEIIL